MSFLFAACTTPNATTAPDSQSNTPQEKLVRIGYQKSGTLNLVKHQGGLEKRLASQGAVVKWSEFSAGPQLLEALNVGSIDFGHTGDAPAVFAQAAGTPFLYISNTPPSPESVALLIPKNSLIRQLTDLKGKKIGLTKGSSAHYFLVEALARAKLKITDIQTVYLTPPDARAAFEQGSIDAWAIWDPFFAAAQLKAGASILVDGKNLTAFREFYLASQTFADRHPDLIEPMIEEIQKTGEWALANPQAVAEFLAPRLGIDVETLEQAERRRKRYGAKLIQDEAITEQQQIADTFFQLGLIPKSIKITDAVRKKSQ